MTPILPFNQEDLAKLSAKPSTSFSSQLRKVLQGLKLVLDAAQKGGPTPQLEEAYGDIREWLLSHSPEIQALLVGPQPPLGGSRGKTPLWSLQPKSADGLFFILKNPFLWVDKSSKPQDWRPLLTALIQELKKPRKSPAKKQQPLGF